MSGDKIAGGTGVVSVSESKAQLAVLKAKEKEIRAQIAKERAVTEPTQTEYKGHPVLTIPLANGKPFTFGKSKAEAMIKHFKAITVFAQG